MTIVALQDSELLLLDSLRSLYHWLHRSHDDIYNGRGARIWRARQIALASLRRLCVALVHKRRFLLQWINLSIGEFGFKANFQLRRIDWILHLYRRNDEFRKRNDEYLVWCCVKLLSTFIRMMILSKSLEIDIKSQSKLNPHFDYR